MTDHIVKSFDQELHHLKEMVETMGRLTCEQLGAAVDAIEKSDRDMAKRVIEREPQADRMEHEIDRLTIRLLALRQPVASTCARHYRLRGLPTSSKESATMPRIWPSAASACVLLVASRWHRL